jgi:hypothetical protein
VLKLNLMKAGKEPPYIQLSSIAFTFLRLGGRIQKEMEDTVT